MLHTVFAVVMVIIGGICVVVEINTLTFYLLGVGLAAFAAAIAAFLGVPVQGSLLICAATLLVDLPLAHWLRRRLNRNAASTKVSENDAGQAVVILAIRPNGAFRVSYRGSGWDARTEADSRVPAVGETWVIDHREGNLLFLKHSADLRTPPLPESAP
ncbi:MAG: NfeD family protein [Rhodanobacteraceae bacterium]